MLECSAVPNLFLNGHIRKYQRRVFKKSCQNSVLLNMKKVPQKRFVEKIGIDNTLVTLAQISRPPGVAECTSSMKQARVLPNILRPSMPKSQLESETSLTTSEANSITEQSVVPDYLRGSTEVDADRSKRQNRKRKQDYKQANIRQDPSESLDVKHTTRTADTQRRRRSKMARLSMDKKIEKEVLKSKGRDANENTEVFEYNTSSAIPESEMLVSDTSSSADQFPHPNEYSSSKAMEEMYYDELIDFSSNNIFSKCYYDSYSKQSVEISLELNERLDDIQSILNCSFNRDTSSEQCQINDNIANEEILEFPNCVPMAGDDLPKCELSSEELGWMNEWLSGKEIEVDVIFENSHIREKFDKLSAKSYNCNFSPQDETNTDWDKRSKAQGGFCNFMELNTSLSDEEKNKILESDEMAEILMKEIDEIDATDLLRSGTTNNNETRSSGDLTEIMLSALMDEVYPFCQNSIDVKTSKEAETFSNTTEDINEKEWKDTAAYSNDNNNNEKEDEEIREEEACSSSDSDTDEEFGYIVDSYFDNSDSSDAPQTPFTSDNDTDSSANDAEQKNHRPAAPLRKSKRKKGEKPRKPKKQLYECSLCSIPLRFRYSRTLKLHTEAAHKGLYDLLCESCGRRFNKQYTYNRHVTNCRWMKEKFECHECGKEYRHKSSLVAHRKSKHETDDKIESKKKHVCRVCLKAFASTGRYNNHVRSHENDW